MRELQAEICATFSEGDSICNSGLIYTNLLLVKSCPFKRIGRRFIGFAGAPFNRGDRPQHVATDETGT